ncbi:MAG: phenylalanine--tRNA ligase subunit beta [Clostridia bacterium]|jgi:phenylalanyl-tRNA synthetase beta chain
MITPISWLKDYIDIDLSVKDFCDVLTLSGTKVEGYRQVGEGISCVVVGKIVDLIDHPNSDHLKIAQVDIGNKVIQVVTGAPNVESGQVIPVATDGAHLPNGVIIKKGKLRGELSEGMMCSISELNLTKHDYPEACDNGIWILPPDLVLGSDVKTFAGLDDHAIEFEITPNRPDCYCLKGIAREASVAMRSRFNEKVINLREEGRGHSDDYCKVMISAPDLCTRYCARIITDVTIKPSPDWMRQRLRNAGVRPISNIVDITNYVMLEYGQPMHAFDLEYIEGSSINVRRAYEGEKVITLDEKERALDPSMLVISDANKPIAIAGVMGAMNSEVKEDTGTVLFESAMFNPTSIRLTAKKVGLRTESSGLFEKGLDANNSILAVNRACELVELLGAGKVVKGTIDVHKELPEETSIYLDVKKINELLGTSIETGFMTDILSRLGMDVDKDLRVTVPTFRPDVKGTADLAEEVARFYGYNNIRSTLSLGDSVTMGMKTLSQTVESMIRNMMVSCGLYEVMTYSFISPKNYDKLELPEGDPLRDSLVIKNPLGEDFSVMRTTTIPSMLKVISYNNSRKLGSGRFFELSKTYHRANVLANEVDILTAGIYGDCDFYDLKGVAENLFMSLGIRNVTYRTQEENCIYHKGRAADIYINDVYAGKLGQINYKVSENFDIPENTYVMTLLVRSLVDYTDFTRKYVPLPKYPSMERDLSIIVDNNILSADIIGTAKTAAGKILESIKLFDIYTGNQIGKGQKSISYSFVFRSAEKTLEEDEVTRAMDKILKSLEKEFKAQIRC